MLKLKSLGAMNVVVALSVILAPRSYVYAMSPANIHLAKTDVIDTSSAIENRHQRQSHHRGRYTKLQKKRTHRHHRQKTKRKLIEPKAPNVLLPEKNSAVVPMQSSVDLPDPYAPPQASVERLRVEASAWPQWKGKAIDVRLHAGAVMPGGNLFENVASGLVYGGGVAKEVRFDPWQSLRTVLAINRTVLAATPQSLTGGLTINMATLRLDYMLGGNNVRPFIGVAGGVFYWTGFTQQKAKTLAKNQTRLDVGGQASVGIDVTVAGHFAIAPELAWTYIAGGFADSFYSAALVARMRI